MNILITGAKGFVGKRLYQELSYNPNYNIFSQFDENEYNLTYRDDVDYLFSIAEPDIVIHLAARVGGIGANAENPGLFMRDNLEMGINVINAALDYGVEKFIMTGTVCMYPKYTAVPFKEEDIWNGYPEETNAPYGIAKKALMELCIAYNKQYKFNAVNLVPVNMYGPGDSFDPSKSHVIPAIILKVYKALIHCEPFITIWGTGNATREFLYVDDFIQAVKLAIEKEPGPQPINIGVGKEISISYLADRICNKMCYLGKIRYDDTKPDGQPRRCLDISRAKSVLGYEPQMDLDMGLNYTVEWFLQNIDKMRKYLQ